MLTGSYAFRQHSSFGTVDQVIAAGPNVFPLDVPPGFTVAEVATRVGQLPGHSRADFAAVADGGTVRPRGSRPDPPTWTGCWARARMWWCPGRPTPPCCTPWCDRFDRLANRVDAGPGRPGWD